LKPFKKGSRVIYFTFSYALREVRSEERSLDQEQVQRGVHREWHVREDRRDKAER
jgi:hypothetical protein